jgi:hypothetical protein
MITRTQNYRILKFFKTQEILLYLDSALMTKIPASDLKFSHQIPAPMPGICEKFLSQYMEVLPKNSLHLFLPICHYHIII